MNRSTTAIAGASLAGLSGLALIIVMLIFGWFDYGAGIGGVDALKGFHDWVLFILLFAAIAGLALGLVGTATLRVDLPVALSAIAAALGIAATIVLIIYLISPPDPPFSGAEGIDVGREIGIWLGLLSAIGIAAGGWLAMQEEGTSFGAQADRLQERERRPPPPPPPAVGTGTPPSTGGPAA